MFEFDPEKSRSNLEKHGIDFIEAQQLWRGPIALLQSPFSEEPRSVVIGKIKLKFWSAIITYRHDNIRIISVRRSRPNERKIWQDRYQS